MPLKSWVVRIWWSNIQNRCAWPGDTSTLHCACQVQRKCRSHVVWTTLLLWYYFLRTTSLNVFFWNCIWLNPLSPRYCSFANVNEFMQNYKAFWKHYFSYLFIVFVPDCNFLLSTCILASSCLLPSTMIHFSCLYFLLFRSLETSCLGLHTCIVVDTVSLTQFESFCVSRRFIKWSRKYQE